VQNVTRELAAKGYEVKRGYWTLWGTEQCKFTIHVLERCFGPNPTAPYALPFVPAWRDEFVDPSLHNVFGAELRGYSPIYRLGEREALVVLGVLPPPGAYLGLQTYVFTREGRINEGDPIYQALTAAGDTELRNLLFTTAPNPSRVFVWATIGNSNNNVVIERQSESAFDQERFFIVTPDAITERDVTQALLRAGVPHANWIFVEKVAKDIVKLGLGPAADEFQTVLRYAQVPDDDRGEAWRERLPLTVLRVRDTNTTRATESYPVPAYDEKTANSELSLQGDLDNLISAVKEQWHQPDADVAPFIVGELMPPQGIDEIGQHCLARPMNCLGDNQDDSFRIGPTLPLDGGQIFAVVGTLATATNNATYVSLAINSFPLAVSIYNLTNLQLAGTASEFADSVANADKFYVYYISRHCTGIAHCLEIPQSVVPFGGSAKPTERNYVRPTTARAPDATQLLVPSVIMLKGP
jgi:hypothetical protein